jgi:hypothetical protein
MHSGAVEQLGEATQCSERGFHLLRSQCSDGGKHSKVSCSGTAQAASQCFLDSFCVCGINAACAFFLSQLNLGAVLRLGLMVGRVPWLLWLRMFEAFQGSLSASQHGDVTHAVLSVPLQSQSGAAPAFPVCVNLAPFVESGDWATNAGLVGAADAKATNNQAEQQVSCFVLPWSQGVAGWCEAIWSKELLQPRRLV